MVERFVYIKAAGVHVFLFCFNQIKIHVRMSVAGRYSYYILTTSIEFTTLHCNILVTKQAKSLKNERN